MQAAVVSLLRDEELNYKHSFYYWAGFICHGYASVKLDDELLDKIHERLIEYSEKSYDHGDDRYGSDLML